ncbi:hypothetical protein RHGRI_021742 [Rhododendron griersonianum]|uniref:F-box protein n=1 Tax=Rhododendron griersonianum TaxID=479676 RepID=A0AAV6JLL4_9ERIC|nr:hypothetical protein RHGRI_021742 [Rhododendron griersonianum]
MANPNSSTPFSDFPEDVQLCILSFLTPSEISAFAATSKTSLSLCRHLSPKLWFSLCHRRWSSKTLIHKWSHRNKIPFKHLYQTLDAYDQLIGFWRRSGTAGAKTLVHSPPPPPLVFFEWGPSFVAGSRVSPCKTPGLYHVIKSPFIWLGIGANGEPVSFVDPECKLELCDDLERLLDNDELVPVSVSFMGSGHVVVEENANFSYSNSPEGGRIRRVSSSGNLRGEECGVVVEDVSGSPGSLPDRLVSEIYQHFANRTSPGGERASRRQRRREKERQGRRRKWEPEHFVKIVNCSPTRLRPLQGLWKGICDDMNLDFYLVSYDDIGGIACRKVGDSSHLFAEYSPVFWTSNTTFIESPFSAEEEYIYDCRIHLRPPEATDSIHGQLPWMENHVVSRILDINSSYDLVIPNLAGASVNPRQVQGRIWLYGNGTFGFGFLRNNYIIDLKHISQNGCILDTMELCND